MQRWKTSWWIVAHIREQTATQIISCSWRLWKSGWLRQRQHSIQPLNLEELEKEKAVTLCSRGDQQVYSIGGCTRWGNPRRISGKVPRQSCWKWPDRNNQPRIQPIHQRRQDQGNGKRQHSVPHTHSEWTTRAGEYVPIPSVPDYTSWWMYDVPD